MTIKKNDQRQWAIASETTIAAADFTVAAQVEDAVLIRAFSTIILAVLIVDSVFDNAATLTITDSAGNTLGTVDGTVAGVTSLTLPGTRYSGTTNVRVAANNLPTVGSARLVIQTIERDRSNENIG